MSDKERGMPEPEKAGQCPGCGVKLQSEDPGRLGYIPRAALERSPVICQRCFRIKHYNEVSNATLDQNAFLQMLNRVGRTPCLVVHIVDLFDFEGSLIGGLQRFVGTNPVVLAVNKIDLLPKNTNFNRILNWVQKTAKDNGLRTEAIVFVSAKKGTGMDRLIEAIGRLRGKKDICVVGATNVGKSSLINRLIKDYSELDEELTVSRFPGTTLDLIRIPLDDGASVIDTPGIVYPSRLTEVVDKRDLPAIVPEKPLKPIVYQLQERQTLFFGALARFDFERGAPQSFTCYVADGLRIHRTKLEQADELYARHKGGLLSPPKSPEEAEQLPPLARQELRVARGMKADVLISGLGWIRVNGDAGATLGVWAPKGVKVLLRPAMI